MQTDRVACVQLARLSNNLGSVPCSLAHMTGRAGKLTADPTIS